MNNSPRGDDYPGAQNIELTPSPLIHAQYRPFVKLMAVYRLGPIPAAIELVAFVFYGDGTAKAYQSLRDMQINGLAAADRPTVKGPVFIIGFH